MSDKPITEIQHLMNQRQAFLMVVDTLERRIQALGGNLAVRTADLRKEYKRLREEQYGVRSR